MQKWLAIRVMEYYINCLILYSHAIVKILQPTSSTIWIAVIWNTVNKIFVSFSLSLDEPQPLNHVDKFNHIYR
jgi:hypothetical protein